MRLPIGLLMLAISSSAIAAGQDAPGTIFHSALQVVLVLLGLAAALVAVRWMYVWNQCRKSLVPPPERSKSVLPVARSPIADTEGIAQVCPSPAHAGLRQ